MPLSAAERRFEMTKLYPMQLSSLPMERIWGGDKLGKKFNKNCGDGIGETWELSVRKKENSNILNGEYGGMPLSSIICREGNAILGSKFSGGDFPLLIKLIDAADTLSVQVHPDDEYASRVEGDVGKTEMWHILEADEGAQLVYGLCDGVSAEDFARAVREGKTQSALKYVDVRPGDTFFIPSGLVHAIGSGIVLAEIQQNCDLTYRVYDFDRRDKDGNLRELHVEKAIETTKCFSEDEIDTIRYECCTEGARDIELLAHCRYFKVKKLEIESARGIVVGSESFMSLLCTDGEGTLMCGGIGYKIQRGDGYFLPAGLGQISISGNLTVITSEI